MKRLFNILLFGLLSMVILSLSSCKDDVDSERPFTVKSQTMISEYLDAREDLSLFKKIADMAIDTSVNYEDESYTAEYQPKYEGDSLIGWVPDSVRGAASAIRYGNLLSSRGNYTVFVPNNDAVQAYLNEIGVASVEAMTEKQRSDFMNFHILRSQVALRSLVTGSMNVADTTSMGVRHYIDMEKSAQDSIYINKDALVLNALPKETYNGYVYIINHVLNPHPNYLEGYLKDAGRFSIMLEAFKKAGLDKSLLRTLRAPHRDSTLRTKAAYEALFSTILAVPDEAYKNAGINSLADLEAQINTWTDNLASDTAWSNHYSVSPDSLLKAYLLYHIVPGVEDMDRSGNNLIFYGRTCYQFCDSSRMMATMVRDSFPNLIGYTIYTDKGTGHGSNAVLNDGISTMLYKLSDIYTKNGYVHELTAPLVMKKSTKAITQSRIVVELEDLYFRFASAMGQESNMNKPNSTLYSKETEENVLNVYSNVKFTTSKPSAGDYATGKALTFSPSGTGSWIEFVIRDLPAGEYKAYLNFWRQSNAATNVLVYWRNVKEEFSALDHRLKLSPLNLSDYTTRVYYDGELTATGDRPYYEIYVNKETQQSMPLQTVVAPVMGDYAIRFLHVDYKPSYYDSLTLELVKSY